VPEIPRRLCSFFLAPVSGVPVLESTTGGLRAVVTSFSYASGEIRDTYQKILGDIPIHLYRPGPRRSRGPGLGRRPVLPALAPSGFWTKKQKPLAFVATLLHVQVCFFTEEVSFWGLPSRSHRKIKQVGWGWGEEGRKSGRSVGRGRAARPHSNPVLFGSLMLVSSRLAGRVQFLGRGL